MSSLFATGSPCGEAKAELALSAVSSPLPVAVSPLRGMPVGRSLDSAGKESDPSLTRPETRLRRVIEQTGVQSNELACKTCSSDEGCYQNLAEKKGFLRRL